MKKFLAVLLTIAIFSVCAIPVAAVQREENIIAVFEDGSYLVEEFEIITSEISPWVSTTATSGTRVIRNYDANTVEQWNYTLHVNLLYREGISSLVQNRWDDYEIYNTEWSMVSHTTYIDQPAAYGSYELKKTFLFITVATASNTIGLTCDTYGNISRC